MSNAKRRLTLEEMLSASLEKSGRLACPACNCEDFRTYGNQPFEGIMFRYRECRHCGKRILTKQFPEIFVRDVDARKPEPDKKSPTDADQEIDYGDEELL